jgi:hypothetical protein
MENGIPSVKSQLFRLLKEKLTALFSKVTRVYRNNSLRTSTNNILAKTTMTNLVSMNQSLQNHQFVSLEKPPQTLFTKDSTQVFSSPKNGKPIHLTE